MSNIWFTSDLHFNHAKALLFREDMYESVEHMNETIIENFNEVVLPQDTVYLLGDVCLGKPEFAAALMQRLNGHKHLIIGNHDTKAKIEEYATNNVFESMLYSNLVKINKRHYYLSHYQCIVKNHTENPVWCLHGHTHSDGIWSEYDQNFHVGWDAWDTPISIESIEYLTKTHKTWL